VPAALLAGQPLSVYLPVAERRDFLTQLSRLAQTHGVQEWDVRLQPPKRAAFEASLRVGVVRDTGGQLTGLRWLLRDITERKQAEAVLRQAKEAAEARALVKAQLAACHDYLERQRTRTRDLDPTSFESLVLESKLTAAESILDWLNRVATLITPRRR